MRFSKWHALGNSYLLVERAQAALAGANAAVVGVLLAALHRPVIAESVRSEQDLVAALIAFGLLQHWKVPAWLVVAGMAASGQWLLH